MANKYIINGDKLTRLADAVRSKTGEVAPMTIDTMTQKLNALETGNAAASETLKQAVRDAYQDTTSLEIPSGVGITSIRESFMRENNTINQVTIPEGVESIGRFAFFNDSSLVRVKFPTTLKTIKKSAFYYTGLTSFTIPTNVETIGDYAFGYQAAGDVMLKDTNLKTVGIYAFSREDSGDYTCKTIDGLPETLESIGTGAFRYCVFKKTDVNLPNLKTLGQLAFTQKSGGTIPISNFYAPKLEELSTDSFADSNQKIKIDELLSGAKSVTLSTYSTFTGVKKLILTYEGVATLTFKGSSGYRLGTSVLIFVPDSFLDAYKSSSTWGKYKEQIHGISEMNPSSVTISTISKFNIHKGGKSFKVSTVFDNALHAVSRKATATLTAEGNATISQDGTVTLTDAAKAGDVITIKATADSDSNVTGTASVSIVDEPTSYSINLNGQWEDSKATGSNGEIIYQSGTTADNGTSTATITFQGYDTLKMMVRTNGESDYDYLEVGPLDKTATRDNSANIFSGRGKASATQFYEVDIPVTDKTQTHTVQVIYSKDSGRAGGTDKGYFYILEN